MRPSQHLPNTSTILPRPRPHPACQRANGKFKIGCVAVASSSEQKRYFDEADADVKRVETLLAHCREPASAVVLAEAVHVGGVTTLCRAHSQEVLEGMVYVDQQTALTYQAARCFYRCDTTNIIVRTHGANSGYFTEWFALFVGCFFSIFFM